MPLPVTVPSRALDGRTSGRDVAGTPHRPTNSSARSAQLVAPRGRAPVLPHDRSVAGLARLPVPHDGRLSLVGDPDCGDRVVERRHELRQRGLDGVPDLEGVVLDPAWAREMLWEL